MPNRKKLWFQLTALAAAGAALIWLWQGHASFGEAQAKPAPATGAITAAASRADLRPFDPASATPEQMLDRIFSEIERHRINDALQLTDELLARQPNYRLAHLIRGDLLLARARPISTLGAVERGPADKLDDLRAEAIARLRALREKPPADQLPRYLLQLRPDQQHAIVVDTRRSRLYLYRNEAQGDGVPRLETDYYITQGKLGANKLQEGDKKTPIGVYHVTGSLARNKLADLYGNGAFPLNYPNEWDKRQGRTGSGIWLHGTPSNTYARAPRASDGCVVLTNEDLDRLADKLQMGLTPVIISDSVEWVSPGDWARERDELRATIKRWQADWESRDTERLLRHYSSRFSAGGQNLESFAAQKRLANSNKDWISVGVENLALLRDPGKEEMVVATFEQEYRSDNLRNRMLKRQYWVRENGLWKIIYEGSA